MSPISQVIIALLILQLVAQALAQVCICKQAVCPVSGVNTLTLKSGARAEYYYRDHSGVSVIKSAMVTITRRDLDSGSDVATCVRAYSQSMDEGHQAADAGHILGKRLGGPGDQPINIFPQNLHINRGFYRTFEKVIYKCLAHGLANSVKLTWDFYYKSTRSTKAREVTYTAKYPRGSQCETVTRSFPNT